MGEAVEREYEEIRELKERLAKLEAYLEKEKVPEEKERIIKQEIKSYLQELQETPSFAPPQNTRDEVEEIRSFEPDRQIGALISLTFEKGLSTSISVARGLNNPAITDEFHDILVDRYYQMLMENGLLPFP